MRHRSPVVRGIACAALLAVGPSAMARAASDDLSGRAYSAVGEAFPELLRSLVNGKSVAVDNVEYTASNYFLRAHDCVNDARIFIQNRVASFPRTDVVVGGD